MDGSFDFIIGLLLSLLLGGLIVFAMVKIRGSFTSSEVHRLVRKIANFKSGKNKRIDLYGRKLHVQEKIIEFIEYIPEK